MLFLVLLRLVYLRITGPGPLATDVRLFSSPSISGSNGESWS